MSTMGVHPIAVLGNQEQTLLEGSLRLLDAPLGLLDAVPLSDASVLLDALLVSTVASSLLLLGALALGRLRRWSGDLRHQLLTHALLAGVAILAITTVAKPGPIGCLTASCQRDTTLGERAARTQQYHTAAAAGKFSDLAPAESSAAATTSTDEQAAAAGETIPAPSVASLVLVVWIAGAGVSLARAARRRWLARRFVREARPVTDPALNSRFASLARRCGLRRRVPLLEHPTLPSPVVAGALRPALLVPRGFASGAPDDMVADDMAAGDMVADDMVAEIVFLHELAHLRRRDPLVTLLGDLAGACFWFNPITRLAARRLRELQELAADSHVLRGGVQPSRYSRFLLDAFRELSTAAQSAAVPHAHPIAGGCLLETRVRTILDPRAAHRAPSRTATVSIALAFAVLCGALSWSPAALQARGLLTQQTRPVSGLDRSLLDAESLDRVVRPVFIDHMADRYIAGATISVVHDGEIVYRAGFGRREVFQEIPVDPERTIWRIGSISKVMTGVAVLQLADRGLLDLDADVDDLLSEVQVPATFEEPVRVRHLLTHTAGFDQIGLGRHASSHEEVRPLGDFLAENLVRIRPPGVVSTYDTYGITLAGHLVEEVTGLSYEEVLERHVFEPLDMHRSAIVVPGALEADVATGYGFAGHWEAEPWEHMNTAPASSVSSTATDMARFAIMLLERGRYQERQVLSEESARAMLTRQWSNHPDQPGYSYTLWEDRSYGVEAFSHGGSMAGFGSLLYLVPEHDLGVFIACNQESGSLPHAVLTALMDALFPGRATTPELRARLRPPLDVSRFTGTYANSMHHHTDPAAGWKRQPLELEADQEGRLVFGGEPAFAVGPLSFQRDDGLLITFSESPEGEIVYMFVNQTVYEKLE